MVVVSHDLETIAPLIDRLVVVDDGAIVVDAPADELLRDPTLLGEHGIAIPQLSALNTAFAKRDPDWATAPNASEVAEGIWARGLVPRPSGSEATLGIEATP
jgi:ABC-type glutathione transport system ATPase component